MSLYKEARINENTQGKRPVKDGAIGMMKLPVKECQRLWEPPDARKVAWNLQKEEPSKGTNCA